MSFYKPHFNFMKKLLIVCAVCTATITLFSFKPKDAANVAMQENIEYSVNIALSKSFVEHYYANADIGFENPEIAGWLRAGVYYAKAVWYATGRNAITKLFKEIMNAQPPFVYETQYGLTAEDLATAEEIGLISRL